MEEEMPTSASSGSCSAGATRPPTELLATSPIPDETNRLEYLAWHIDDGADIGFIRRLIQDWIEAA